MDEIISASSQNVNDSEQRYVGAEELDNRKIATDLVNSYIMETLINSDSDPRSYWRIKENESLAKLARRYLSSPQANASSK